MTVAVTRRELSAGDLRREAKRCRDAAASRRMLALALVLEGSSRGEAARHAGMTGRPCATGFTATTPRASPACVTGLARGRSRGSPPSRSPSWKRSWSKGRTRDETGSCAGGGSICRP